VKVKYCYAYLTNRILRKKYTIAMLAAELGMSERSLKRRLHNEVFFRWKELEKIQKQLNLSNDDMCRCFFVRCPCDRIL
jgi:AraC-like DNA-binding protein